MRNMKISFVPKLHNCDKHLKHEEFKDESGCLDEFLDYCEICGRIKKHISYGEEHVNNYHPKRKTVMNLKNGFPF